MNRYKIYKIYKIYKQNVVEQDEIRNSNEDKTFGH